MARVAASLVRLVVVLVVGGALLAASLVAVGLSTDKMVHSVATAKEIQLANLALQAEVPSVIYAADGSVLATLRSSENRQPVSLSEISPTLVAAVLDTEDHGFWAHGGLDIKSTARALLADVNAGSAVQGGSTIAQQLVKNTYLTDQKTMTRKIREAVLAARLEQRYTKAQILDAYLNTVYLGNGAYGAEAAAKEYFGEDASQLDLAQSALLAGLIQAPSGYDPITNPVGARIRRSQVLARMVHYHSVSAAAAAAANATPLPTVVHDPPGISYTTYGWYVQAVVEQLLDNLALGTTRDERVSALFTGGLKIYTNEEPRLQAYAQKVSVSDIPSSLPDVVSAMTVMDPRTGNVEAVVGGPDGSSSEFDDATQGERQPGSGFKLFTLLAALQNGYNVNDSILAQSPCAIQFPGVPYEFGYNLDHPMNNDPGDPDGPVSLVEATAMSINCAYLRLAHEVGLSKVIATARALGVSDPTLNASNPSLVIGSEAVRPIEMTAAYAAVADGGIYHAPVFVNHVVDRSGAVIFNGESKGRRVFSAQIADEALVALRATVQWGTGTAAALPNAEVAGKTGTTEHSVDAWFNGITPDLACSVWMGDPHGEVPMYIDGQEVFGASYPTQIWHDVAAYALASASYSQFPAPDYSGLPPVEYINSPALEHDDLIAHGWPPPAPTTTTSAPKAAHKGAKPSGANSPGGAGSPSPSQTPNTGILPKTPPGPAPTAPNQAALLPTAPSPPGGHRAPHNTAGALVRASGVLPTTVNRG